MRTTTIITIILIAAMAALPPALGEQTSEADLTGDMLYALFQEHTDAINAHVDEVPGFFRRTFGDQRINIYINLDDGELAELYVVTEGSRIAAVSLGAGEDATMEIRSTEAVVRDLMTGDDPLGVIYGGLDSNDITYTTLTFRTSFMVGAARATLRVFRFFGGMFSAG
ncbi:hypothetical protein JXB02_00690 [Candidatus Woesearchaeota archaeon]|nr:hypothetical protein [Candidatus Woesearchaeota archaeon]